VTVECCVATATSVSGATIAGVAMTTFAIDVACALASDVHARQVGPLLRIGQACAPERQHDIEQLVRARDVIAPASGVRSNNASASDAATPRIERMVLRSERRRPGGWRGGVSPPIEWRRDGARPAGGDAGVPRLRNGDVCVLMRV